MNQTNYKIKTPVSIAAIKTVYLLETAAQQYDTK